ncbi:hypothetical protein OPT61_g7144 [Boeremia exigua]|uniref:Uncharacterized protein n=1 Tax=Boeremia exigua TaxID=749465 RepID=A0ACC2I3G2_9PLEO|nr:hypothetical protein OPT61_g7144 [Boeremia exigua]
MAGSAALEARHAAAAGDGVLDSGAGRVAADCGCVSDAGNSGGVSDSGAGGPRAAQEGETDGDAIRLAAAAEGLLSPEKKVGKEGGLPMARAIIPPNAAVDIGLFHLLLLSARLDCHPRILDKLYLTPPKWLLQRSVSKALAYLTQDDELIRRDGGVQALDKQELLRACVDRGIDVLGKSEAEQRKNLGQWYKM